MKTRATTILFAFTTIAIFLNFGLISDSIETTHNNNVFGDPCEPEIQLYICGGYPSTHPHWRFDLIEEQTALSYSWTASNFSFDSGTTGWYVVGRPVSAGSFTLYCTATYNCYVHPWGYFNYTYNKSITLHTDDNCF